MRPDLVVFMQGLVKRDRLIIGFADDLSGLTVSNKEHVRSSSQLSCLRLLYLFVILIQH